MTILIFARRVGQTFLLRRILGISLLVILLVIAAAGCQSNQAESATVTVMETQPPSTATSEPTEIPLPTAPPEPSPTPAPPTDTPAPTKVPTPEVVTIPYMDLDTDRNPVAMPQWLKIYRPDEGSAPYPTIFLLPDLVFNTPTDYRGVVKAFLARGYAVVLVKYQAEGAKEDDLYLLDSVLSANEGWRSCALAWTAAFGGDYDLDLDRLVVFSVEGTSGVEMPLYDAAMWAETLTECSYPVPAPDAVKGVISFDATLGMLDTTLQRFPGKFGELWNIPQEDIMRMTDILMATPPDDWYKAGVLDEDTHNRLARLLPLYWVYKTSAEGPFTPSYLLIYDRGGKDIFDYVAEAEGMAAHMRTAGIAVTLQVMPDANSWDLVDSTTDVAERVVEAADKFISRLFK
ncbi:MAG: hypothetical protein E4H27_01765 [Anaerolineales bacterium]|nr:MAG: hypothetical protein E4H27_01765 [Anaerolineales bacterium]